MAAISSLRVAVVALAVVGGADAQVFLSPANDINLPASDSAKEPLQWLGGNSPYFAGPSIYGVSNAVPEGCTVEQVAYNMRHGSRYPDTGAYNGWVTLQTKIQAATFTGTGSLAFLKSWKPVLTNPTAQIAKQSNTGYKEAHDLGYQLRTKYPKLYSFGDAYITWANLYQGVNSRVVETAKSYMRGFMGPAASQLGQVIAVDSHGPAGSLFDSLSPSDLCPTFSDGNGGDKANTWNAQYLPPITARLNALLTGNLVFTDSDVQGFPYLCGFESQITGTLSPFCSIFTDDELKSYEYAQDLRYYYGTGPGVDIASKMMLPYIRAQVGLLARGPNQNGTAADGSSFAIPNILTAFYNDGQTVEAGAASGIWDDVLSLPATEIPAGHKYIGSHFVSMRGTLAFERLRCPDASKPKARAARVEEKRAEATAPSCNHDNCLRQMIGQISKVSAFCPTFTAMPSLAAGPLPTFVSNCGGLASRVSSACSCLVTPTAVPTSTTMVTSTSTTTTSSSSSAPTSAPTGDADVYIRILLNDAVYPLPSCQNGPGKTCAMNDYVKYLDDKWAKVGDLVAKCNVTAEGTPASGELKGASFFTDLRSSWLVSVSP